VAKPRGSGRVDPRAVECQPVESMQAAKRGGFDDVHVTIVERQATEIRESEKRVVRDRVEARHRELDPLGLVGQFIEIAQVAVDTHVGDRPFVVGDRG